VSAQKIGSKVNCPECGAKIVVPSSATALGPEAPKTTGSGISSPPPLPNLGASRGAAKPVSGSPARPGQAAAAPKSAAKPGLAKPAAAKIQAPTPVRQPVPQTRPKPVVDYGRISISRSVLYFQAVLILVVAILAFVAGFFIGRGGQAPLATHPAHSDPVVMNGSVSYRTESASLPDSDAVIIVLPQEAVPPQKIGQDGLRPQDPPPNETNANVRAIRSLEGIFVRADEAGKFSFVLPPGEYWVLTISRHAARPAGQLAEPDDLAALAEYFAAPGELLGGARYKWQLMKLAPNQPLDFDFVPEI
jgi:hypothetical protein